MTATLRSAPLAWQPEQHFASGSRYWLSKCGRYRIHASEECYGVTMPCVYFVSHLTYARGVDRAIWRPIGETRSYRRAVQLCRNHKRGEA